MNIKKMILLLQSRAGMTQSEIAAELGCVQSNISALSRRGSPRPSNRMVDGLRQLLTKHGLTEP